MYRNFSYAYSVVLLPIAVNYKVGDSRALDNPGVFLMLIFAWN